MDSKEEELKKLEAAQNGQSAEAKYVAPDPSDGAETANIDVLRPNEDPHDLSHLRNPVAGLPVDPAVLHGAVDGLQHALPTKPPLPITTTPGRPPRLPIPTAHDANPSLPPTLSPSHTHGARTHEVADNVGASSVDMGYAIASISETLNANMVNMLNQTLNQMSSKMDESNMVMENRLQSQLLDLERRQDHNFNVLSSAFDADRAHDAVTPVPPPPMHGTPPPLNREDRYPNDLRNNIADLSHQFYFQNRRPPSPQRASNGPPFDRPNDTVNVSRSRSIPNGPPSPFSATDTTVNDMRSHSMLNSSRYPSVRSSEGQQIGQSFRSGDFTRTSFHHRSGSSIRQRSSMLGIADPSTQHRPSEWNSIGDPNDVNTHAIHYGQLSRSMENAIRTLNPNSNLLHTLKKSSKVLSKVTVTYSPWSNYWDGVFNSCYLNCLAYIDPRHVPDTRSEWEVMDHDPETRAAREITTQLLLSGTTPNPTRDDSVLTLNGIFLGVIDVFPAIQSILVNGMRDSLEEGSLAHVRDEDQNDITSLRTMYFGAHMLFLSPLNDARESALLDLLSNTTYKLTMSPVEFLDKTLLKAKRVNKLFQSKQITDSQLWTIVFRAVKNTVGSTYDGCIDRFRTDPGFIDHSPITLRSMFQVMDTKYKEKKRSADQPYAMVLHQSGTTNDEVSVFQSFVDSWKESANFAGNAPNGGRTGNRNSKTLNNPSNSANSTKTKDLPCFAFQRNGKCDYPNCKYSHDSRVIANAPPPPEKGSVIAMILDDVVDKSLAYTELAAALTQANRVIKKLKRFKKKTTAKPKTCSTVSTYQGVVKGKDAANALVPFAPDGNSSLMKIEVVPSDESDNDDDDDTNDTDDDSTESQE